jgi:hypothetical protein
MTRLEEFIHFNKRCPICNNEITLYAQFLGSVCFKARSNEDGITYFHPFMNKSNLSDEDYFSYHIKEDCIQFSQSQVFSKIRKDQLYFFYLCNENGFKPILSGSDYEINIYKGCYYRDSSILDIIKITRNSIEQIAKWNLQTSVLDKELINSKEVFSVSFKEDNREKMFYLYLSYEQNTTTLWYYSATTEELKDLSYKPSIFEKELKGIILRPDFSIKNRDKLFTKLNSLVIFS